MPSNKSTKTCRCCHGKLTIKRPSYLTIAVMSRICDDCFKTMRPRTFDQVEYNKKSVCKGCKKNVPRGFKFGKKLFCQDCMWTSESLEAFSWWPTFIDCCDNYIKGTPVEN